MSKASNTAPIFDPVVDANGKASLSWVLFFNSLYEGDVGTDWTPDIVSLTQTGGAATVSAKYYRIGRRLCFFRIKITPVTNTSSVSGTTYVQNLPFTPYSDGVCMSVAGTAGGALGIVSAGSGRIYFPAWSAVIVPVSILGFVEVSG